MPLPRASHTSVTTEDRIIMFVPLKPSLSPFVIILCRFGGSDSRRDYNDTWSFDISTRTWTELHCTGPIPSSRSGHAAVLIDDVMYVFGGFTMDKTYLDDLIALRLSSEWFSVLKVYTTLFRSEMQHCDGINFTMRAQFHIDGHVIPWLLTGHVSFYLEDGQKVHRRMRFPLFTFLIQVCTSFCHLIWTTSKIDNTEHIKYPETDTNAASPNEKAIQVVRKSYAGPPTQDQPQHSTSSAHGTFPLRKVTPSVLGCPPSLQVYDKRNPGPNGRPLQPTGVNRKPRHVPEGDAVSLDEKATQVARKSWAGPPTQDQPQHSSSSSLEDHMKKPYAGPPTLEQPQHSTSLARGTFPLRKVTPAVLGCPPSPQVTDKRSPGPNGRPFQPAGVNRKPRHVPEGDAVSLNEKVTQVARKSWAGPPTRDQPQHSSSSSLEDFTKKPYAGPPTLEQPQYSTSSAHGAFPLRKVTPVVLGCPPSPQVTDKRNPGPNGRPLQPTSVNNKPRQSDVSEGSKGYHAGFVAPHSSEGDVAKSDLERKLSVSLAAQTERDQRIAQLTDELALRSALLEQADANAAEAAKRAGLELREHADRLLMQSSRAKGDVELGDMQAKPLSRDQQCEKELAYMRVKLEAKESELEAIRLRLAEAEEGWIKSKGEADALRAQTAASRDDDQVIRRLIERVRDIEAKMASMQWNEKSIEAMECRNEG